MSHDEQFIVEFNKKSYDISEFVSKHPGGVNTLGGLKNRTIDGKLEKYQHSKAALKLLEQYRIGSNGDDELEVREYANANL